MGTFIETPLCQQVLQIWKENCLKDGPVAPESVTSINDVHFMMHYVDVDLGREHYEIPTADGFSILYHQIELKSDIPGRKKYSECFTFRKGEIEMLASWDFYVREHYVAREDENNLFVVEQGVERDYDSPPIVVERKSYRKGTIIDEKFLATPGFEEGDDNSYAVVSSVSSKLDEVRVRWQDLARAAEKFAKGFAPRYEKTGASTCDELYMLHSIKGTQYLTNLGGSRFIDAVNAAENTEAGLRAAYMQFQPRLMYHNKVASIDEVLEKINDSGRIALFTTEEHALKLLGKADMNYGLLRMNRMTVGNREFRLSLKRKDLDMFLDEFMDCLFCEDEYKILALKYCIDEVHVRESIRLAEKSPVVKAREQMRGVERRVQMAGVPVHELLTEMESEFYDELEDTKEMLAPELQLFEEYKWWCDLRESAGLVLIAQLNNNHFMARERQLDFRNKFAESHSEDMDALRGLDYSMFLQIDPERSPSQNGDRYRFKRKGIGNIIIDFGDRRMLEVINKKTEDLRQAFETSDDAGKARLWNHVVDTTYENYKERMTAYLFKGHLLQPMLDRMLPAAGSTVAIDTNRDRVEELARFCELGDDPYTLRYNGVDLVFVNNEARMTMEALRNDAENDVLADIVRDVLDKAEKKDDE